MMKEFSDFEKKLNIKFKNKDLLTQAFVHRSYLNENPDFNLSHNERLEFLGDAVIELVISQYLYHEYPSKPEGDLTNWRASLVNAKMLAQTAQELDLGEFLLLSKGEAKEDGKAKQYILANTFESLMGAMYLDSGYEVCDKFLKKHLIVKLPNIIENNLFKDSKSRFQEEAQERAGITPVYRVAKEWGPDHSKSFVVGVFLKDEPIAEGEGSSKQEAEESAAKNALVKKSW
ncbi:ribonuclease III [Patescibacteria group bacterium]|nr:ribonuclease III [Patescibacteria group bacterium]